MLDVDSAASQCRDQVDLGLVEEVVVSAGEPGMRLLLNLEDHVASEDAGCLVTLTTELNLGAALDTAIYVDVEDLAIDNCLLAEALLAAVLVLDKLTLTIAVRADGLKALDHGPHLAHHRLHAVAVAARAFSDSALLAAPALALGADDGALKGQLRDLAAVDVFEGDVVNVVNRLGLGRAALVVHAAKHASEAAAETAAAKELSEEVLSRHTTAAASAPF